MNDLTEVLNAPKKKRNMIWVKKQISMMKKIRGRHKRDMKYPKLPFIGAGGKRGDGALVIRKSPLQNKHYNHITGIYTLPGIMEKVFKKRKDLIKNKMSLVGVKR